MDIVAGDVPVVGAVEPVPVMDTILTWIGFDQAATRNRIREEGFESFNDLMIMKEKDIRDLAESYGRRTVADGRVIFGLRQIRYLIGLIHWVQDFGRINEMPTINGINNGVEFCKALDTAFYRADVRKIEKDHQADTVSKAADPGKLKDKRQWPEWEPAFVNYLLTIPGVSGVPLSYVMREKETSEPGVEYGSFNERSIACAPLAGPSFQADARKVHQLIKSLNNGSSPLPVIRVDAKTCRHCEITIVVRAIHVVASPPQKNSVTPFIIKMRSHFSSLHSLINYRRCSTSLKKKKKKSRSRQK